MTVVLLYYTSQRTLNRTFRVCVESRFCASNVQLCRQGGWMYSLLLHCCVLHWHQENHVSRASIVEYNGVADVGLSCLIFITCDIYMQWESSSCLSARTRHSKKIIWFRRLHILCVHRTVHKQDTRYGWSLSLHNLQLQWLEKCQQRGCTPYLGRLFVRGVL